MRRHRRAAGVDNYYTPRLALGNRHEAFAHAREESPRLLLETIFVVAMAPSPRNAFISPARATYAGMSVGIEQNRQIRLQIPAKHTMQFQHITTTQLAAIALIG